ncbi:CRTAC1 family protein [Sandaracinus amylolyticus]|uniref:ASPIC/UnbV domain-containing protein n=1 Tax=Sandaracinus amylolyticus TaxID=927083 RepID=A0A0F6SEI5_9BACT|nr:CRTAC1 family protein [Sandaracinus amylolyticus]AKF05254.1 ASPIC/UnbV domain-containing protein [Sandaracinus amylolyticus]
MQRRVVVAFVVWVSLAGCEDRCANVECAVAGAVCSPDDGLCHCGAPSGELCGADQFCDAEACTDLPPPICGAGNRWEPGEPAFREATSEWGLDGVEGVRIEAIDYDGDEWTDLVVRRIPAGVDDFAPGGARHTWLLRNTRDGRFEDVTERSGFLTRRAGSGGRAVDVIAWGDVDGDGDLDAYLGVSSLDGEGAPREDQSDILVQQGGVFTVGAAVRFDVGLDAPAGASFVDHDLDGDLDLFVGHHNVTSPATGQLVFLQDVLWRNDGAGRFEDATSAAGLETRDWVSLDDLDAARAHSRAWSTAACDLNDDGLSELLVASYGRAPNHLWRARRDENGVVYDNASIESGYAFDDDRSWEDNQFARCFCQANRAAEGCAEVPAPAVSCADNWSHDSDRRPFRLGGNSGATICGDVDNDGDVDLLTTEIRHWWAGAGADGAELLLNTGDPAVRFERPGRDATGLVIPHADPASWDEGIITAAFFDFDLDGWMDVWLGGSEYPGNHGLLYQQDTPGHFREVPIADGIDHHRAQGVAVADFDRDGDLDVVLGHSRMRCGPPDECYPTAQVRLFESLASDGGEASWVQLRLEGGGTVNRSAIGARVTVRTPGVAQTREIEGGHGHYGDQGDLALTFGLGAACEAEVDVRWPDSAGTRETFRVTAGHRFVVQRGAGATLVTR